MKLTSLEAVLEKICPLCISEEFKKNGAHDNSGVIIRANEEVNKILFTLDLTLSSVAKAKEIGADTILTHHPAIYHPISNLDMCGATSALLNAVKSNMNVISMHLNLDACYGGIDDCLAEAFGAKKTKAITKVDKGSGYGKEFTVEKTNLIELKQKAIEVLQSDKVLIYGDTQEEITKVATFCGAGGSDVQAYFGKAQVVISGDLPHRVIKDLLEDGKSVVHLTHFASENYGFEKFYNRVKEEVGEEVKCEYFTDERFI